MPRRSHPSCLSVEINPQMRLWLLRLLVPLGAQSEFVGTRGFNNERMATTLGLQDWQDGGRRNYLEKSVRRMLRTLYETAERERAVPTPPSVLCSNIERLRSLVGLTETDCRILELATLIHSDRLLDDTADMLGSLNSLKVFSVLAVLLGLPEIEVRRSLGATGALARTGLVAVSKQGAGLLRAKLDLLSATFADGMLTEQADPMALLKDVVLPVTPPSLEFADFSHVEETLIILRSYLRRATADRRPGVNAFIYGDPGTGKSQLARLLAQDLGAELFEVASEDSDGDPIKGDLRLRAFRAAQSFFEQRRALILFDETEDVFDDGEPVFGRKSTAQIRKAWMNRTLEMNPVPTLWLSNSVRCMDPAFVRRFDVVLELKIPSQQRREQIITQACGDLVTPQGRARIAAADALAPAVITRAAAVIDTIRHALPAANLSRAVEHLVNNTLIAQGHPALVRIDAESLPDYYDPRFLNVDADLLAVADGIARSPGARLCLYGPPGTGKTAYGRWLAQRLQRPLHARKVSDIVSPYVGETERKLARVFRDAETEGAVLLLDEVDSFLHDRRSAQRSWEVTAVNEMLTQMEAFTGVFVASTNLMEGLDPAAMRRFDLKLHFGYLKIDQAWQLFIRQSEALSLGSPPLALRRDLARLPLLTPGDFAATVRQHRFRAMASPESLLSALAAECVLKEDGKRRAIGFT